MRCGSVVVGEQPIRRSHTPAIPRYQAGKTVPRHGRREVVANAALMLEEFGGYHSTDGVAAVVLGPTGAAPVSIKAGEGVRATGLEFPPSTLRSTIPAVSLISTIQESRFRGATMPICAPGIPRRHGIRLKDRHWYGGAAIEAVVRYRGGDPIRPAFKRIAERRGKMIARVAAARLGPQGRALTPLGNAWARRGREAQPKTSSRARRNSPLRWCLPWPQRKSR